MEQENAIEVAVENQIGKLILDIIKLKQIILELKGGKKDLEKSKNNPS